MNRPLRGRQRWFRLWRGVTLLVESVVPVAIVVLVIDCVSRVAWASYASRDAQIYASVARFWADGYMPYRDVYDFKPPLIYAVMRLVFACCGYHPDGLRRALMLLTGLGALALYGGLRRAGYAVAAPVSAIALLTLVIPDTWAYAFQNTELLVASFGAIGLGCAAAHQADRRWWWATGTGVACALATLGKQPGIFYAVPLVAHLCLWNGSGSWQHRLRNGAASSALFGAGFACVMGVTAAYFAWNGALPHLLEAVTVDGQRYAAVDATTFLTPSGWTYLVQRPSSRLIADWMIRKDDDTQIGFIFRQWPFIGSLYLLLPATIWRRLPLTPVVWLWVLAGYLASIASPRDFDHYTIVTFPAIALAGGVCAETLFSRWSLRADSAKTLWLAVGMVIAGLFFGSRWYASYVPRRHLDLTHEHDEGGPLFAEPILAAAGPGDTLLTESEPFTVYLYSGVRPASRFIYWDAPHPDAVRDRQVSLQRRPSFIVLKPHSYDRARDREVVASDPEYAALADILGEYIEIFAHPDNVVLMHVGSTWRTLSERQPRNHE